MLALAVPLAGCSDSEKGAAGGSVQAAVPAKRETNRPNDQLLLEGGPSSDFVQGDIRITPPVAREKDRKGEGVLWIYNEGGTRKIPLHDAKGRSFDVFIDHQIGSPTPGAIYLNAYPRESNSIRVLRPDEFRQKVGDFDK